ncbi:ACP S-malonyltransferase [Streptomyces armeniacus]|uniref:ACP S-malonyltransferase n=1 Tax=Streptomyces armeniacus TaxID=83291 RepID=A0A345XQ04_9ACTN|nr:acyltransferase domain-containing protein [Streptomyces armeniacus]AXK33720.1 ACP S-malonyltransferase [Streptomyces armeniacus]QIQ28641.1 Nbc45 [Streptomyces sp.]
MALAFIFGSNQFNYQPDGILQFYDENASVRDTFQHVAKWTGLDVDTLLRADVAAEGSPEHQVRVNLVGLAAAQLSIHDILVEKGIRPAMVGGLSLGGLVASCVAGAVSREDLISLLFRGNQRLEPHEGGRAQGAATVFAPLAVDPEWYYGEQREGVWLGGDFGLEPTGRSRVLMLAGFRDALEKLRDEAPEHTVTVSEDVNIAVHTPLRAAALEETRRQVSEVPFSDPQLKLCSSIEQKVLTTAGEVREMFYRNVAEPMSNVHMYEGMKSNGAQLALVVGPSLIKDLLKFPFPVGYVDNPGAIPEAISAIFEHGVEIQDD